MSIVHFLCSKVRSRISTVPAVYLPLARLRHWSSRARIVSIDTDIVIEGFPRSGNTFAVRSFLLSQPGPAKIAHHLHAAAQVLWALDHHIPAIVLVRHPKDAIASLVLRNPEISLAKAFDDYITFYRALLGKSGFVVAEFEDVVTDFGEIICRVNKLFGTSFVPFQPTEENNQKVFEAIEKRHLELTGQPSVNELMVARPSETKKQAKLQIEKAIAGEYAGRLREAEELWQNFCNKT